VNVLPISRREHYRTLSHRRLAQFAAVDDELDIMLYSKVS
jgi:hypothetical protein